jgi:phage I-like protein
MSIKLTDTLRLRSSDEIQLGEGKDTSTVQVLRVGKFKHPRYGNMDITKQTLADMVQNFGENVRRQDLPIDFFHESDKEAAGWITKLYTAQDGKALLADAKWTPRAQKKIQDREVRYFSADFAFQWTDPETSVGYKNVLFGGGLVNRPFVKDMKPVIELSEGDQMKTVEQLEGELKTLSEQNAKLLSDKDAEIKTLSEKLSAAESEVSTARAEKAKVAKEAEEAALLSEFEGMVKEGKAVPAQKDAWLKNDTKEFARLAKPVNLSENGGNGGGTSKEGVYQLSDADKAACKLFGITEEEFCKHNPQK